METRSATSAQHRRPAVERRFKSECAARAGPARRNWSSTTVNSKSSPRYAVPAGDLGKEWMGCALRALARDRIERGRQFVVSELQPESIGEHLAILTAVSQHPPLHLARCMTDVQPGVKQGDPGPVGPRSRRNQVAAVRAVGMARGKPVAYLVFGIDARQQYDAVNMLPALA